MAWLRHFSDSADPETGGIKTAVIATAITLAMTAVGFIGAALVHIMPS